MDWATAKDAILGFMAAGFASLIIYELHTLRMSIETLNISVAQVFERTTEHERRISKLEDIKV